MLRKDADADETVSDYKLTRSSEKDYDESDACSLFSVLSVDTSTQSIRSSVSTRSGDSSDTVYWSLNSYNMSETSIVSIGNESYQGSFPRCPAHSQIHNTLGRFLYQLCG